jgi:hypothetical protein
MKTVVHDSDRPVVIGREGSASERYVARETKSGDWMVYDRNGGNLPETRGTQAHAEAEARRLSEAFQEADNAFRAAVAEKQARMAERPDLTRRWGALSELRREWRGLVADREAAAGRVGRAANRTTAVHSDGRLHAHDLASRAADAQGDVDKMRDVYDTLSGAVSRISAACRAGDWSTAEAELTAAEAFAARWDWTCYDVREKCAAAVELGRRGGAATSPEKATAARKNGKLGGRPRKPQPYCTQPRRAGEGCETCSLVTYGRDCMNNPIG